MLGSFPFQCYQSITHSNTMKGLLFKCKKQTKFHPISQVNWHFRNSRKVFSVFYTKAIKSKHRQTSKDVSVSSLHEYTPNPNLSFCMSFWFWVTVLSLRLFCLTAKEMAYTKVQLSLTPETSLGISPEQAPILQMLFSRIARQHGVSCLAAACFQNAKTNM